MSSQTDVTLTRIVMELAREPGHPAGDPGERYTIIAPLTDDGHLDAEAWAAVKERCRVTRESGNDENAVGHLTRAQGGAWRIRYDISGDREEERGFRFGEERFVAGEYISIEGEDGTQVYRIVVAAPL